MNSLTSYSFHPTVASTHRLPPCFQIKPQNLSTSCHRYNGHHLFPFSLSIQVTKHTSLHAADSNVDAIISPPEGAIPVIQLEEFIEKDWSLLDSDKSNVEQFNQNVERIITAGKIEETSRVMVSIGSEEFVDKLVDSSPCNLLLVVHDSLLTLALIKEKYDKVKCWQGEIIYVPEKWAPLDIVFLYFLPGLPFKLDQILEVLAKRCSPGARLVISHPQGREVLEQLRQQHPLAVISDLPDKVTLERVAAAHSFDIAEFVDEHGFYLAVLSFLGSGK